MMTLGRKTATSALLIGTVAFSLVAQADTAGSSTPVTTTQRNPVEWLFSDLKSLLAPDGTTAESPAVPESEFLKTPEPAAPTAILAEPTPNAAAAGESGSLTNPFTAILRELAKLFDGSTKNTPDAVAETEHAPVSVPVAEAPLKMSPQPSAEPPAKTTTNPTPHSNPVSWLVSDLFGLFSGNKEEAAPIEDNSQTADRAPVARTPQPADEVAGVTLPPETPPNTPAEPVTENAAWHVNSRGSIFDPEAPAISLDPSLPLISRTAPVETAETRPLPTAASQDAAEKIEPLRIRPRPTLADLNIGNLGRKHKAVTEDPADQGFFSNLFSAFSGGNDVEATPAPQPSEAVEAPTPPQSEVLTSTISDRIVPEESLDLGYTAPDTDVTRRSVEAISENAVTDIDLFLGDKILIGNELLADALESGNCIERPVHLSVFCLQPMNWPAKVAGLFAQDTAYTMPGEGVVRYENGRLSRAYNVFNAADFADVVKYMQRRFGPPSEREIVWMHMLEAPELPNTTFRWKALSADRRDVIILEVRNYDDLRRSFADLHHGMVRLYRDGSRPIFKHLSTMDLMLLQRRRIANAPADPAPENSAN